MSNRRSYYAFLRAVKQKYEITHREAQAAWRGVRDRLQRKPLAADVVRHPRITAQETKRAQKDIARKQAKAQAVSAQQAVSEETDVVIVEDPIFVTGKKRGR